MIHSFDAFLNETWNMEEKLSVTGIDLSNWIFPSELWPAKLTSVPQKGFKPFIIEEDIFKFQWKCTT